MIKLLMCLLVTINFLWANGSNDSELEYFTVMCQTATEPYCPLYMSGWCHDEYENIPVKYAIQVFSSNFEDEDEDESDDRFLIMNMINEKELLLENIKLDWTNDQLDTAMITANLNEHKAEIKLEKRFSTKFEHPDAETWTGTFEYLNDKDNNKNHKENVICQVWLPEFLERCICSNDPCECF